jgi:uncharacterized membrane protein HdeD (DUF308 family)
MATKATKRNEFKSQGHHYLILVGVLILLIGFVVTVFARQLGAGIVILLIGVFVCAVGLSKHSQSLIRRRRS